MYYLFDLVVNRCGNNVIRVQHKGDIVNPVQDLPDTIHIGGRISPSTVWDYVGKLKTSLSKVKLFTMRYLYTTYFLVEDPKVTPLSLGLPCPQELCLIRFHPATEEEEVAYVSLFSYFSSRKRFGVVANNNRRIKDLYLIPLSAKDPLPSKLLPFDGPGKHLQGDTVASDNPHTGSIMMCQYT